MKAERQPCQNLGFFGPVGSAKALIEAPFVKELFATYLDLCVQVLCGRDACLLLTFFENR